jgi:hypothetical protein
MAGFARRKAKTHPLQKPQRVRHPELQLLSSKGKRNFKPEAKGRPPAPFAHRRIGHPEIQGHAPVPKRWSTRPGGHNARQVRKTTAPIVKVQFATIQGSMLFVR